MIESGSRCIADIASSRHQNVSYKNQRQWKRVFLITDYKEFNANLIDFD
jgi:hypothetical protein